MEQLQLGNQQANQQARAVSARVAPAVLARCRHIHSHRDCIKRLNNQCVIFEKDLDQTSADSEPAAESRRLRMTIRLAAPGPSTLHRARRTRRRSHRHGSRRDGYRKGVFVHN